MHQKKYDSYQPLPAPLCVPVCMLFAYQEITNYIFHAKYFRSLMRRLLSGWLHTVLTLIHSIMLILLILLIKDQFILSQESCVKMILLVAARERQLMGFYLKYAFPVEALYATCALFWFKN